jgi:hypothetical protein
MTDHTHLEIAVRPTIDVRQRRCRLIQNPDFAAKSCRHPPPRQLLERDQPIGTCQRVQGGTRIALDVFVDVGPGQSHDQRPIRIELAKAPDALGTAPGMQRNHQVRGRLLIFAGNVDLVTEPA